MCESLMHHIGLADVLVGSAFVKGAVDSPHELAIVELMEAARDAYITQMQLVANLMNSDAVNYMDASDKEKC